jgi:hypothetical protein
MLFREIIAVYCENHTEHINTLWGQNAGFFFNVKAGGTYSYRCALKCYQTIVHVLNEHIVKILNFINQIPSSEADNYSAFW